MENSFLTTISGKINQYLHHIDLKEFGKEKILSSYIAEFDNDILFLDCGTSLEVKNLLNYAKKNNLDLHKVKYLITTHHHFDHCGGMWLLYDKVKRFSPNVKIITNQGTKELLNNYSSHLNRAKRTFGSFVGEMNPIEDNAFKLISPETNYDKGLPLIAILDTFKSGKNQIKLAILKTPGHTPDHQCPVFIMNDEIDFIIYGEAMGTIYHSSKLLTMPTSMPVFFNYHDYMATLSKLKTLVPNNAGFCHFGVVHGKDNIKNLIFEHEVFMEQFRDNVIKAYKEKPETKYVFEKLMPSLLPRTDLVGNKHPIMDNVVLGVIYGMLMDLGYRKD